MDALPASRIHLLIMGIHCMPCSPSRFHVWSVFVTITTITCFIVQICLQLYGTVFFDNILLINTSQLTVLLFELTIYVLMISRTQRLFVMLRYAFRHLDKGIVLKIRSFDMRHVIFKTVYMLSVIVALVIYFLIVGVKDEASIVVLGFRATFEPHYVVCLLILSVWTHYIFLFLMSFYISVLFVTVQVAKQLKSHFMLSAILGTPDYAMMIRYLEWYNRLMKTVNEEIGFMPFALLGMEFVGFACANSFLVTGSKDVGISPYFVVLTVGAVNVTFVKSFYQVIHLGHQSRRFITSAWKFAEKSVSDTDDGLLVDDRNRKALKFFLMTESIVVAKAADIIMIDRSLVLNFFNQLIPFTVMMFTTIKEFEK